jgi:adenine-specific DNA methylase
MSNVRINGESKRAMVCYPLTDSVAAAVAKLAEEGRAKIYDEEVRFVTGRAIPVRREEPVAAPVVQAERAPATHALSRAPIAGMVSFLKAEVAKQEAAVEEPVAEEQAVEEPVVEELVVTTAWPELAAPEEEVPVAEAPEEEAPEVEVPEAPKEKPSRRSK